jgi:capsid assembly protease
MIPRRLTLHPSAGIAVARNPKSWDLEFAVATRDAGAPGFARIGPFAVVDVCGVLVQHEHWCLQSYDSIQASAREAFASDAPQVLLRVDSPGGDFAGALDLSRWLRATARETGKRLVAHTDSQAASAAYAIACAADELVMSASALVGSIGVWAALASQAELNERMGLRYVILASGARKLDRNPNLPITEGAAAATQDKVDAMARLFFDLVAEQRGLAIANIAALEGDELLGISAVKVGLADRLETFDRLVGGAVAVSNARASSTGAAMAKAEEKKDDTKDGWDEALATLHKMADGEDEEKAARARRMLAAMYEEGKGKSGEEPEPEKKDAEGEKKVAKSEGGETEQEKKKEGEAAKAKASAGSGELALAARVHALEAAAAQRELDTERKELLASRPDFSAEIVATLSKQPLEVVQEAVKTWAKIPGRGRQQALAAPASVTGTRGEQQNGSPSDALDVSPTEADVIDRKMGIKAASRATRVTDRSLELGPMTHEEAAKRALELGTELGRNGA